MTHAVAATPAAPAAPIVLADEFTALPPEPPLLEIVPLLVVVHVA